MIMVYGFSATAFKAWPQTVCFYVGPRTRHSNLDNRCTTTFSNPVAGLPSRALVVPRKSIRLHQYPPPGSGYLGAEDEKCYLPDTYEPTMEYPGTLRPGKTRENISFQDLPIGDDDPDPIPWPHFQEIDFYHIWPAPHPDPKPIDDMIAEFGRWATPEEEAEMMRDARRGARLMKEMQEAEKKAFVLVDDDDDEPAELVEDEGDAIVSGLREQLRGIQTTSKPLGKKQRGADTITEGEDEAIDFSELNFDESGDEEDDFLFDLGWVVLFSKLVLYSILVEFTRFNFCLTITHNGSLDEEDNGEDILKSDGTKSNLIGASAEEDTPIEDIVDTDVLDDVVPTDVLDDIEDADGVLGLDNFSDDDDDDDYYVGGAEDDYGDLDAYDDNEGVY